MNNQAIIQELIKAVNKQGGFKSPSFNLGRFFSDVKRLNNRYNLNQTTPKIILSNEYREVNKAYLATRRRLRSKLKLTENFKRAGFDIDNRLIKSKLEITKRNLLIKNKTRLSITKVKAFNKSVEKIFKPQGFNDVPFKKGTRKIITDLKDILGDYSDLKLTYASKEEEISELKEQYPNLITRDDIIGIFDVSPKIADDVLSELETIGVEIV